MQRIFLTSLEDERYRRAARYWDQLRGDRMLPLRREFKFSADPELAANASILFRGKADELKVWFPGSELMHLSGEDYTGRDLMEFFPTPLRHAVDSWIATALPLPCAWISDYRGRMPDGGDRSLQSLSLPLNNEGGVTRYILLINRTEDGDLGLPLGQFFPAVSRVIYQPIDIGAGCPEPIDIGAGCPEPVDVTAATAFT